MVGWNDDESVKLGHRATKNLQGTIDALDAQMEKIHRVAENGKISPEKAEEMIHERAELKQDMIGTLLENGSVYPSFRHTEFLHVSAAERAKSGDPHVAKKADKQLGLLAKDPYLSETEAAYIRDLAKKALGSQPGADSSPANLSYNQRTFLREYIEEYKAHISDPKAAAAEVAHAVGGSAGIFKMDVNDDPVMRKVLDRSDQPYLIDDSAEYGSMGNKPPEVRETQGQPKVETGQVR